VRAGKFKLMHVQSQHDPGCCSAGWVLWSENGIIKEIDMNSIIWLVGLVVIVLFIAGYFGLR